MKLLINGGQRELPAGLTLQGAVQFLGIREEMVAVQRNDEIIPRGRLGDIPLAEGDKIEIVHMVGGG